MKASAFVSWLCRFLTDLLLSVFKDGDCHHTKINDSPLTNRNIKNEYDVM